MSSKLVIKQYHRVFRYSQWMRSHFTFLGNLLLIIFLMSGVFGVDTAATTTYQLFVFLLVIFCFAVLNSLFIHLKISVTRQLPRYFTQGESSQYTIKLKNLSEHCYKNLVLSEQLKEYSTEPRELDDWYQASSQLWYKKNISFNQWREYFIHKRGGIIAKMQVPDLPEKKYNKTVRVNVNFIPYRRGKLCFKGFKIAHPDLLGLFMKLLFIADKQSCLVLPRRYSMASLALAGSKKYQAGGVSLANSVGASSEFMSLREYREGDPLNSLHWKSFARHGKLIVKEYQDEYFSRRALLLDTFIDALPATGNQSSAENRRRHDYFEAAISVAASVCMSEQQNEALLDLMFVGKQTHRFTSGRGIDHMPHIQEVLASVQTSTGTFEQLKKAIINHIHVCSSVICVLMSWNKERQALIHLLQAHDIPLAVFLVHDGSVMLDDLIDRPKHLYLINHHNIAADLEAV